jgi:hypothetical protein
MRGNGCHEIAYRLRLWRCQGRQQHLSCSSSRAILPASDTVSGSFWFPFSHSGNRNWFVNGRKELPNQSFSSCFLHAATVGGRGVCVAQTCTDARSACKTAHVGTARPTPRSKWLRRYSFLTCAVVQPLVLRSQAALGAGFSLQAAFWYQNAMLALFLRSKKSLKRSLILVPSRRKNQFFVSYNT